MKRGIAILEMKKIEMIIKGKEIIAVKVISQEWTNITMTTAISMNKACTTEAKPDSIDCDIWSTSLVIVESVSPKGCPSK